MSRSTRPTRRRRGQSLVEFALVLPIFVLLLFGLIDVGRYVYLNSVMSQAAREAARVGSVEASWMGKTDAACGTVGGPVCPANLTALRNDMAAAANRMIQPFGAIAVGNVYTSCDPGTGSPPSSANWQTTTCTSHDTNDLISVRITATFTPLTPVGRIVSNVTTSGAATMVIN